jgi:hypothetical protein
MADYLKPITFRPTAEAALAIEKIRLSLLPQKTWVNMTDVLVKALVEYAKTLPDPPKESAPLKVE